MLVVAEQMAAGVGGEAGAGAAAAVGAGAAAVVGGAAAVAVGWRRWRRRRRRRGQAILDGSWAGSRRRCSSAYSSEKRLFVGGSLGKV